MIDEQDASFAGGDSQFRKDLAHGRSGRDLHLDRWLAPTVSAQRCVQIDPNRRHDNFSRYEVEHLVEFGVGNVEHRVVGRERLVSEKVGQAVRSGGEAGRHVELPFAR